MTRWRRGPRHRLAVLAFAVISLALGACKAKQDDSKASASDVEAINKLHQRDIEASKKWDVESLVSLWTDDIVTLPPDGPPVIGKEANRASLLKMRDESRGFKVTEYNLAFSEIEVAGEWAFEWGTFSGATEPEGGGPPARSSGKVLRVLKRESDGWKIARTIYNGSGPEGGDR